MTRTIGTAALSLAALTALVAACSGTVISGTPGVGPDGGANGGDGSSISPAGDGSVGNADPLPCAVDAILAKNCRSCHGATPTYGAPMPLVTYADTQAAARSNPTKKVYELLGLRIHDDANPMPQPPNARLGTADTAVVDSWIANGAPAAAPGRNKCGGIGVNDAGTTSDASTGTLDCTPDTHMAPAQAWAMPQDLNDEYVCYGFDVTPAQKRHLVGIAPLIGNPKIVHHLLLFQADVSVSPTPSPCAYGGSAKWRIVYGWAPGGTAFTFPPEAGYPEEGTTHFVAQVHYNNVNHLAGESDSSGFDLCTTDKLRPNDADTVAFGTIQGINVPAHGSQDVTCGFTVPSAAPPLHLFSAFPHMHQLGKTIETVQLPGGTGAPVSLGGQASWDFRAQLYFGINADLKPGDVVKTRCAWDNPTANRVGFGPNTEDEMCFSFTMYYPRIQLPNWNWETPALSSSCVPTPP